MSNALVSGTVIGTGLQTAMVVIGHMLPPEQREWLFPVVGTLLGGVTGWFGAGAGGTGTRAGRGAAAGGIAGVLGSLVSTALGDVPLMNAAIAGSATVVSGAIGAALRKAPGVARA